MTAFDAINREIHRWLDATIECDCGRTHTIALKEFVMAEGATQHLPDVVRSLGLSGEATLVADEITYEVGGEAVEQTLRAAGYGVNRVCLPSPCAPDTEAVAAARESIRPETGFVVGVGSGTVNDLAKLAASDAERPYVACPTAPSMNGYPSPIAAILVEGVKRTLPATPPVAIVADLDVVASAPREMIQAGLADLLSKTTATADWRMSSLLLDDYYCPRPHLMLEGAGTACRELAAEIGRGGPEAVRIFTAALVLSGLSMVVAGSSSPASGGEHLMSHYWEMTRYVEGKRTILHGLQVGLGMLVTATLYERLARLSPRLASTDEPSWDSVRERVHADFGPLADEVEKQFAEKHELGGGRRGRVKKVLSSWDDLWGELRDILLPADDLRLALESAAAPTAAADVGLTDTDVRNAFTRARCIRARYTVLDLAADLGVLDAEADDILRASQVIA